MPTLNESIVEDATLIWFGELGYTIGHGPHRAPGGPAAERGIPASLQEEATDGVGAGGATVGLCGRWHK